MDGAGGPQEPRSNATEAVNKNGTSDEEVPPLPAYAGYSTQPYKRNEEVLRQNALAYSALLGVSIIAVTQLLQTSSLDRPLRVSVFALAAAIPCLTALILCDLEKASHPINIDSHLECLILTPVGVLGSIMGLAGLLFHYGPNVGVAFVVASAIALYTYVRTGMRLRKENKP